MLVLIKAPRLAAVVHYLPFHRVHQLNCNHVLLMGRALQRDVFALNHLSKAFGKEIHVPLVRLAIWGLGGQIIQDANAKLGTTRIHLNVLWVLLLVARALSVDAIALQILTVVFGARMSPFAMVVNHLGSPLRIVRLSAAIAKDLHVVVMELAFLMDAIAQQLLRLAHGHLRPAWSVRSPLHSDKPNIGTKAPTVVNVLLDSDPLAFARATLLSAV